MPKSAGRPPLTGTRMTPHSVALNAEHRKIAREIGGKNISEGIRRALEMCGSRYEATTSKPQKKFPKPLDKCNYIM